MGFDPTLVDANGDPLVPFPPVPFSDDENPAFIYISVIAIMPDHTVCCDNCVIEADPCELTPCRLAEALSYFTYYPHEVLSPVKPVPLSSTLATYIALTNAVVSTPLEINYTWTLNNEVPIIPPPMGANQFPGYPSLGYLDYGTDVLWMPTNPCPLPIAPGITNNICLTVFLHGETFDNGITEFVNCTTTNCMNIPILEPSPGMQFKKSASNLSVYPTPSTGFVTFQFSKKYNDPITYIISKPDGSQVFKQTKLANFSGISSYDKFDLIALTNGFYIYQAKNGKQVWNGKLEIMH